MVGDDRSGKTLEYARDEKRFVRARMKLPNEVTKYGTFAQGCPTHSYRAWVSPSLVIWTSPPRQLSLTVS